METDEALFERAHSGDKAAFEQIYQRYEKRLFGFILKYVGNVAEAEGIFHDMFLNAFESGKTKFKSGGVCAWLHQIARNLCLNRLRSSSFVGPGGPANC